MLKVSAWLRIFILMIEQTELIISEWHYHPPADSTNSEKKLLSSLSLDVMKKRKADKKGIACRFSTRFTFGNETVLEYVAEDSYVIDLADKIDKYELLSMIRNSYSKFKEKFEFRKSATVLWDKSLAPLDESKLDLEAILPLLEEGT